MTTWSILAVDVLVVFGGLTLLTLVISLFPLFFRNKTAPGKTSAPTASAPAAPQEDMDELVAVLTAAVNAYEESSANPLVRNQD